ncbi:MAG TPA: hypothetical protein VG013_42810, partial [Gemmataceae bacterium]|nr:hypothetical protein [Gemmataceae bacterium]
TVTAYDSQNVPTTLTFTWTVTDTNAPPTLPGLGDRTNWPGDVGLHAAGQCQPRRPAGGRRPADLISHRPAPGVSLNPSTGLLSRGGSPSVGCCKK